MLASLTELRSYRVRGTDADLGKINDLGFRQNDWVVRYVVVGMEERREKPCCSPPTSDGSIGIRTRYRRCPAGTSCEYRSAGSFDAVGAG